MIANQVIMHIPLDGIVHTLNWMVLQVQSRQQPNRRQPHAQAAPRHSHANCAAHQVSQSVRSLLKMMM